MYNLPVLERQVIPHLKVLDRKNAGELTDLMRQSFPERLFVMHSAIHPLDWDDIGPTYGRIIRYPDLVAALAIVASLPERLDIGREILSQNLFLEYEALREDGTKVCDSSLIIGLNGTLFSAVSQEEKLIGVYIAQADKRQFLLGKGFNQG